MTRPDLPPLPSDIQWLVDQERKRSACPYDNGEAMLSAVLGRLDSSGGGSDGSHGDASRSDSSALDSTAGTGTPDTAHAIPSAPEPSAVSACTSIANSAGSTVAGATARLALSSAAHPVLSLAVAFAVGNASGALLHAELISPTFSTPSAAVWPQSPAPSPTSLEAPSADPTPSVTPEVTVTAPASQGTYRSTPGPASASVLPPNRDADLAAERNLLDMASTAVARGQGSAALEALESHARRFPRGKLSQEREALWVQALVAAGRGEEARARAQAFRRNFPSSIMAGAIEEAVQSTPQDAGRADRKGGDP